MRVLLVTSGDRNNLNQMVMFVPDEYDPARVAEEARDMGIAAHVVLELPHVAFEQALRDRGVEDYASFTR